MTSQSVHLSVTTGGSPLSASPDAPLPSHLVDSLSARAIAPLPSRRASALRPQQPSISPLLVPLDKTPPIDHTAYPDILAKIIAYAPLQSLIKLRRTSRQLRQQIDTTQLAKHVVYDAFSIQTLAGTSLSEHRDLIPAATHILDIFTPSIRYRKVGSLHHWDDVWPQDDNTVPPHFDIVRTRSRLGRLVGRVSTFIAKTVIHFVDAVVPSAAQVQLPLSALGGAEVVVIHVRFDPTRPISVDPKRLLNFQDRDAFVEGVQYHLIFEPASSTSTGPEDSIDNFHNPWLNRLEDLIMDNDAKCWFVGTQNWTLDWCVPNQPPNPETGFDRRKYYERMGSKAVERSCLVTAKAWAWEKYMSDHPLPQARSWKEHQRTWTNHNLVFKTMEEYAEYWDKRSPRDGIEVITDRYWERRS